MGLLKRKKDGYIPKKSKVLEIDEIKKFICETPDEDYLMIKVFKIYSKYLFIYFVTFFLNYFIYLDSFNNWNMCSVSYP